MVSVKKIVVISFASRLHGVEYYMGLFERTKDMLSETSIPYRLLGPIVDFEDIDEYSREIDIDTLPVYIALTGGVSELMTRFTEKTGFKRVIILGHGEHNSLPSAISTRAKLESRNTSTWLFHCPFMGSEECRVEFRRAMKVAKAISTVLGSKILLVNPSGEISGSIRRFEELFESRVDVLSYRDFEELKKTTRREYVEHFYRVYKTMDFKIPGDRLHEVALFYATTRTYVEREGYSGIAVDCFPYLVNHGVTPCLALALLNSEGFITACEGDLSSLVLMMISRAITGYSGWIANACSFTGDKAIFAHCTISLDMIREGIVVSHFESGYPYSLAGRLIEKEYTLVSLSPDYSKMAITLGRVIESGLINQSMCRTQVVLDMGYDTRRIPLIAPVNHHVLIPGDVREELRAIATLLGLKYLDYREPRGK